MKGRMDPLCEKYDSLPANPGLLGDHLHICRLSYEHAVGGDVLVHTYSYIHGRMDRMSTILAWRASEVCFGDQSCRLLMPRYTSFYIRNEMPRLCTV